MPVKDEEDANDDANDDDEDAHKGDGIHAGDDAARARRERRVSDTKSDSTAAPDVVDVIDVVAPRDDPAADAPSRAGGASGDAAAAASPAWRRWLSRLLPVASLGLGIASSIWMSRRPERAPLIIGLALGGWIVVVAAAIVLRRFHAGDVSRRARAFRFVAIFVSQSVVQEALAFPLPFFAAALWPPVWQHIPFVVAYVGVVVVVFWDPFYARVAQRPVLLVAVQAFTAFVACLTVLPIVGLDNTRTFIAGGVVVAVGAPLWFWLSGQKARKRGSASGAVALFLAILVVVGAPLVPPAPLSLDSAHLWTAVVDREPVGAASRFSQPESLFCHTAVDAPLGLKDQLVHVWRSNGRTIQTVPLVVSGGRSHGFRTWSRLRAPARGTVTCQVETALGQVVGKVSAVVTD